MQTIRCQVPPGGEIEKYWADVPSHLFYPGMLFMSIVALQSVMVRLLVLREEAKKSCHRPAQLWYDSSHWQVWHAPLKERFKVNFSDVAKDFKKSFCLEKKECQALHCLVCMRNMLAHAALSPYALTEDRTAPVAVYVPLGAKNKHCRRCRSYPKPKAATKGVCLPFDAAAVKDYLADVETVKAGLTLISSEMGLEYQDLL